MPDCEHGAVMCARKGSRAIGMRLRWSCRVCGLCSCSLHSSRIGAAGAAAIDAGLVVVPQLQGLIYVVCPVVCKGSWCEVARERGAMAFACAVLLCVRFVLVQPWRYQCR